MGILAEESRHLAFIVQVNEAIEAMMRNSRRVEQLLDRARNREMSRLELYRAHSTTVDELANIQERINTIQRTTELSGFAESASTIATLVKQFLAYQRFMVMATDIIAIDPNQALEYLYQAQAQVVDLSRSMQHVTSNLSAQTKASLLATSAHWDGQLLRILQFSLAGFLVVLVIAGLLAHSIQQRMIELVDQAQASNRAKGEFLAMMSHEIRTPMNGVIGFTDLLLRTSLDGQQREYADYIKSSGMALLGLLNDILDYSKIDAGQLRLECIDFNLLCLLDEVAGFMTTMTGGKGLDSVMTIDPAVPTMLMGDPLRLRQILTNLISNAAKFTEQGGVSLQVGLIPDSLTTRLCFRVKDSGIGIPAAKIPLLFEKFLQLDASTSRRFGGTGLGLAIVKRLTDLMGGTIEVTSSEGHGSEFVVIIPFDSCGQPSSAETGTAEADVAEAGTAGTGKVGSGTAETGSARAQSGNPPSTDACREAHSRSAVQDANPAGTVRILLVEDNRINQLVGMRFLEQLGFQADLANNGEVALRALEQRPYDLVLLDIEMPVLDGHETVRQLRGNGANGANRTIPVIAMTAHARQEDLDRCIESGMQDSITKPLRLESLAEVLARWLPGHVDH